MLNLGLKLFEVENILWRRIGECGHGSIGLIMIILLPKAIDFSFGSHKIHEAFLCSGDNFLDSSFIQCPEFLSLKIKIGLHMLVKVGFEITHNRILIFILNLCFMETYNLSITE